jgi:hypothetical protein
MLSRAREAEILRRYRTEQWTVGTIATQLRVHHGVVRRVLAQAGVPAALGTARPSMLDPFRPLIEETLKQYPTLCASRRYRLVKESGYPGAEDHFRALIARVRPRPSAAAICDYAPGRANQDQSMGHTSARSQSAARNARGWRS